MASCLWATQESVESAARPPLESRRDARREGDRKRRRRRLKRRRKRKRNGLRRERRGENLHEKAACGEEEEECLRNTKRSS